MWRSSTRRPPTLGPPVNGHAGGTDGDHLCLLSVPSSGLDLSRTSGRGTNLTLVSADDDLGLNGLGGVAL